MVDSEDRGFPELANLIDERFNRQGVGKSPARGKFYAKCAEAELAYLQELSADGHARILDRCKAIDQKDLDRKKLKAWATERLREVAKRKTVGRDYWRQRVRQMLRPASIAGRGESRPGDVSGPVMALALSLSLETFAARVGTTVDQIMRPPRIARVDLAAELELLRSRVTDLERFCERLRPFTEGVPPRVNVQIDTESARKLADALAGRDGVRAKTAQRRASRERRTGSPPS